MPRLRNRPCLTLSPMVLLPCCLLLSALAFGQRSLSFVPPQNVVRSEDNTKVRAEGFALGTGVKARSKAIRDARLTAVEIVFESIMGPLTDKEVRTLDEFMEDYLRSSRVLMYEEVEGGTLVTIEAYIRNRVARRDAASFLISGLSTLPTVAVLIAEQRSGEPRPRLRLDGFAANAVSRSLNKRGFHVLDVRQLSAEHGIRELEGVLGSGFTAIARFAREIRADVVVYGEVITVGDENARRGNVGKRRAQLDLTVVNVARQSLEDRIQTEAAVASVRPGDSARQSIEDVAEKAFSDLYIAAALVMGDQPAHEPFMLSIQNAGDPRQIREIVRALKAGNFVTSVDPLRQSGGKAKFSIEYQGSTRDLVHRLTDHEYSDFILRPSMVAGHDLVLEFIAH